MLGRLKKMFFKKQPIDRGERYFLAGRQSVNAGIRVSLRDNFKIDRPGDTIFLKIGDNAVVSGNFIFENANGRMTIGDRTFIGGGDFICISSIDIGSDVLISWGCTIMDNNAHSLDFEFRKNDVVDWKKGIDENKVGYYKDWAHVESKPIVIKDKAWIGFKSIILKGVTIGEGAIVGSGSVVTKDVPDWTVVAGNPAQIIKQLK
jgi:acetyltransferase-like isoleucine patch superfamily enzyme